MSDRLEQQLREALGEHADAFTTAGASARLQSVDYRPRDGRRPQLRLAAVMAIAAAAAAVLVVVLLSAAGGGAPVTHNVGAGVAGWTPVPEDLSPAQQTTVRQRVTSSWSPKCSGSAGSIVLVDVRGRNTFTVYATDPSPTGGWVTVCENEMPQGGASGNTSMHSQWPVPVAADRVRPQLDSYGQLVSANPRLFMPFVYEQVGRAGVGVRSVSVVLNNGTQVEATVENGWYFVWWPAADGYSVKMTVVAQRAPRGESDATYTLADDGGTPVTTGPPDPAMNPAYIARLRERHTLYWEGYRGARLRAAMQRWLQRGS